MGQESDLHTALYAGGFLLLVGMAVWHRLRLERAVAALPGDVRARLGWDRAGGVSARRHRRRIARRLMLRGLPGWVPLSPEARRDLFWHRAFGLGAVVYLVGVLPLVWGAWALVPILGLPAAAILAMQAWWDGPWGSG
jgi:hypothetical protein